MSWRENSDEGLEAAATGTYEVVAAPVAGKKKLVFGLTLTSDVVSGSPIICHVRKKKGATSIRIAQLSVHITQDGQLPAASKQVLKATDESIEINISANPTAGALAWTAQWGDID